MQASFVAAHVPPAVMVADYKLLDTWARQQQMYEYQPPHLDRDISVNDTHVCQMWEQDF